MLGNLIKILSHLFVLYYWILYSNSGSVENRTWGYVTCLTSAFLYTTLPFFAVRKNVRESRGIDGSICGDVCTVLCCSCCAMIQVKREFD